MLEVKGNRWSLYIASTVRRVTEIAGETDIDRMSARPA